MRYRIAYCPRGENRRLKTQLFVSGMELGRSMSSIEEGAGNVRTLTFPSSVREVRSGIFTSNKSLGSVVLNEGLERLGGIKSEDD